ASSKDQHQQQNHDDKADQEYNADSPTEEFEHRTSPVPCFEMLIRSQRLAKSIPLEKDAVPRLQRRIDPAASPARDACIGQWMDSYSFKVFSATTFQLKRVSASLRPFLAIRPALLLSAKAAPSPQAMDS